MSLKQAHEAAARSAGEEAVEAVESSSKPAAKKRKWGGSRLPSPSRRRFCACRRRNVRRENLGAGVHRSPRHELRLSRFR